MAATMVEAAAALARGIRSGALLARSDGPRAGGGAHGGGACARQWIPEVSYVDGGCFGRRWLRRLCDSVTRMAG